MTTDDRRLLQDLEVPPLPRYVRAAALDRSRRALAQARPVSDPWTRLWNHRGVRLGWAVAAGVLLIANIGTGLEERYRAGHEKPRVATVARQLDPELRSIVELPAIDTVAFGRGSAGPRWENAS